MAGLGSLGRLRFVTIAEWNGGQIAREAKVLVPSACAWATGKDDDEPLYDKIVLQSIRCPDPFLTVRKGWLVRRLAPDCSRVELTALPKDRDEYKLPEAMGMETANVHLGSKQLIAKVTCDLGRRPKGWLHAGAEALVQATTKDWQQWQRS